MTAAAHRLVPAWPILIALLLLGAAGIVVAQIEGGDRGAPPIDSSSSLEVTGVLVDVAGKDAEAARLGGWREAQRKGWKMLWGRINGQSPNNAPGLPDSTLDSIVTAIVVEDEQIGPRRYIARLGVLFDRARAGQLLGTRGETLRSPPMLVIPVMITGGTPTTFERLNPWQEAWARYRTGGSPVDYVRTSGTGSDPLLLNLAQTRRPGRGWWRLILDQFGAADIVVPEVAIERDYPGGPITGRFVARHGPDGRVIEQFSLRVSNGEALPQMLDEGVRRIDAAYVRALQDGRLRADPSLVIEEPMEPEELDDLGNASVADDIAPVDGAAYIVQVDTPDAATLGAAETALRGLPGVRASNTTSLALGGVSVMRVAFNGDITALNTALTARGWQVEDIGGALRIRRAAPQAPPPTP